MRHFEMNYWHNPIGTENGDISKFRRKDYVEANCLISYQYSAGRRGSVAECLPSNLGTCVTSSILSSGRFLEWKFGWLPNTGPRLRMKKEGRKHQKGWY